MMLAFGEYTFDLPRRELRHGETVVPVQPKAFDLLAYLIRHRDRVVGKDELLCELWPDEVGTEWALTFSIKLVRQALNDRAGRDAVVRTMRRRGFRFMCAVTEAATAGGPHPPPQPAITNWSPATSNQWMSTLGRGSSDFCGRATAMRQLRDVLDGALLASRDGRRSEAKLISPPPRRRQ